VQLNVGETRWSDLGEFLDFHSEHMPEIKLLVAAERNRDDLTASDAVVIRKVSDLLATVKIHLIFAFFDTYIKPLYNLIKLSQDKELWRKLNFKDTAFEYRRYLGEFVGFDEEMRKAQIFKIGKEKYEELDRDSIEDIVEGVDSECLLAVNNGIKQWDQYVYPSILILEDQQMLFPDGMRMLKLLTSHSSIFPERLRTEYSAFKSCETVALRSEWNYFIQICAGNINLINDNKTLDQWWDENQSLMPHLFQIAKHLFSVSVSGASIERAHKTLSAVLPSDNSRSLLHDDNVSYEVFFSFNSKLIDLWRVESVDLL